MVRLTLDRNESSGLNCPVGRASRRTRLLWMPFSPASTMITRPSFLEVYGDGFRCENGRLLAMRGVRVGMVPRLGIRTAPVPEMRLTEVE